MTDQLEVLTIGHSTLTYERLLHLLRQASVTAVADVRSAPYSRHFPHFNRDSLRKELALDQIEYRFVGEALGGRPTNTGFFCEGVADYEKMAKAPNFERGLALIAEGAKKHRIAMMCSEHDPLDCHRCLLVGRALNDRGLAVRHILSNGQIIGQSDIESKLLELAGATDDDLFDPSHKRLAFAYRQRAMKVAYVDTKLVSGKSLAAE
ncbi:DUF488 domain-containing protein [Mesorhizobium sp. M0185]|uniref:DUF488 domain-containing protein n=1 Tax=unclassified Mesorhizobium TaxID=325217 RepID=UPI003335390E